MAARGRRLRRHRGPLSRAPLVPRRVRAGRQPGLQPPQVDVRAHRLLGALHAPPGPVPACLLPGPRVPDDPPDRTGRGSHGLRRAARPTLSSPQAVVGAAGLRAPGDHRPPPSPRRAGPRARRLDRRRAPLRAPRTGPVLRGVLPRAAPGGDGRRPAGPSQPRPSGAGQRLRRGLPLPHPVGCRDRPAGRHREPRHHDPRRRTVPSPPPAGRDVGERIRGHRETTPAPRRL